MELDLRVNGVIKHVDISEDTSLLDLLRENLNLTGSKYGCGEGECGACTVNIAGEAVRSCVTPASSAVGKDVLTIEGLEREGELHPLQQAFLDNGAFQCGYCTAGMIMSSLALLNSNPDPDREQIIAAMQGSICRCGGYRRIIAAIQQAAKELQEASAQEKQQ